MTGPELNTGELRPIATERLRRVGRPHRLLRPENAGAKARRRWPSGLLGMLALVAAAETSVARRWSVVTEPVAFSWRFSARAAAEDAPGCSLLCLGDSLAKHGLVPSVIEGVTGRRTYNLAAAAAPAPLTYFLFKRALDAGAKPDAVLLELKPGLLAGGPRYRLRDWPEVLSPAETLELSLSARSGAFAAELLLGEALPTFRARHDLRDNLLAALRGETARPRDINAVCRRNWTVNFGANVARPRPAFDGLVSEAQHRDLLSHRFALHKVNARYVRRALDLAAARGIRVYLVIPPLPPAVLTRRGQSGAEAKFNEYVRSLQSIYPGLTVLDARTSGYGHEVFVDPSHLDVRGAFTLSADVADALRADLDSRPVAGRWVDLPAYRPMPAAVALEDVEQSRERLGIPWRP